MVTFLTDAECEALFMCEPPAGQTRRDQIEQILARHVAAALNAAADDVLCEFDPPIDACIWASEWLRNRAAASP